MDESPRSQILRFVEAAGSSALDGVGVNDILAATGLDGDDAFEFIEDFGEQFGVNLDSYIWEFHHSDEGGLLGFGWPFKPPHQKVTRIPISIDMLIEAACAGVWSQQYPPHVPDYRRLDIWGNNLIVIGLPVIALVLLGLFR